MAEKINFTKTVLDGLPIPEAGRVYYYDKITPALAVAVQTTGRKTFVLYKRIGGRPVRYKLGRYPDMSPVLARQEAAKVLGRIASGHNPQEEKRQARRETANMKTLEEVWEAYRDNHLKRNCSARAARDGGYLFAPIPFKNKLLNNIRREEIRDLHRKLGERAPVMANAVVEFLRTLFNYAIDEIEYSGENPVKIRQAAKGDRRRMAGIVKFAEKSRERFLQGSELPAFFEALKTETDEDFRDLVLLLLFTGARRGNVQAMCWANVSLERLEWVIPKTKNGHPHTVTLSPPALQILAKRRANRAPDATTDWVFPATRAKSGHIEEPKKQWWELLKRAKLENLHMHDLRRTLASWQRSTGASLEMIGAALGHRSRQATEIYARIDMDPVRKSVTTAAAALLEAGKFDLSNTNLVQQ